MFSGSLIRSGNNAKTIKGDDIFETAIMYLAPADVALMTTVCANAEIAGCKAACLYSAGRGAYSNVQQARINKTKRYWSDRAAFMKELEENVRKFSHYCYKNGRKPAVRLNGTSDIQWEVGHPVFHQGMWFRSIFEAFPQVQFYDYTKIYKRAYRDLPANYSLTLSYSEASPRYAEAVILAAKETGLNVAVVYRHKEHRDELVGDVEFLNGTSNYVSREVFNGDETDLRFTDPKGVIVGLYAKGSAKKDQSGFVLG